MTAQTPPILILGGTQEGRVLAQACADQGITAMVSLAGATRAAAKLALTTRVGGFGGAGAFAEYLSDTNIRAVIDATHPFAARISNRSFQVCADAGVPYLQILRPAWTPEPGDDWRQIASEEEAATFIPPKATVFLATGRQTLHRFANLAGRQLICRQIDPPEGPFPFEGGQFLVGRPPFSVDDEVALFQKLRVDWLIVKNAGGAASATKLTAARLLKIPVIMIRRPLPTGAPTVGTVDEALTWLSAL